MPEMTAHSSADKASPGRSWFLAYHAIPPCRTEYLYDVSTEQFEQHLEMSLQRNGFSGPAPSFTFDDGHLSNYSYAFPLLQKFGVRATFFLMAKAIGVDSKFMTWQQAREMAAAGHILQSHGWSHRLLTACNSKELDEELVRSKKTLEDHLGIEIDSISMPGGRWNELVVERSARVGYRNIFHSNPWASPTTIDGLRVRGRLMVTGRVTKAGLLALMNSSPAQQMYLRAKYWSKERIKTALGDCLYHRIWCWMANGDPAPGMGRPRMGSDQPPSTEGDQTGDARR